MSKKFDYGHLKSQKFAAFIFAVFVAFVAGFVFAPEVFSTLVMGIVALYTAFVGGRSFSDAQSLKYGGTVNTTDNSKVAPKAAPAPKKEKDNEVD